MCFYGAAINHNEDIMNLFQNFIFISLITNHPLPVETGVCKLVVRGLVSHEIPTEFMDQ